MKITLKPRVDFLLAANDLKRLKLRDGLEVGQIKIGTLSVELQLPGEGPLNPATRMRLEQLVEEFVEQQRQAVLGLISDTNTHLGKLLDDPKIPTGNKQKLAADHTGRLAKAIEVRLGKAKNSLQALLKRQLAVLARQDELLQDARINMGLKFVTGAVNFASSFWNVFKPSWLIQKLWNLPQLGRSLWSACVAALRAWEDESAKLKRLTDSMAETQQALDQAAELRASFAGSLSPKRWDRKQVDELVTCFERCVKTKQALDGAMEETESCLRDYRNAVIKSRRQLEAVAQPLGQLEAKLAELKQAVKQLPQGAPPPMPVKLEIEILAQVMTLKRQVSGGLKDLVGREKAVSDLGKRCKELGVTLDNKTWMDVARDVRQLRLGNFMVDARKVQQQYDELSEACETVSTMAQEIAESYSDA